MSYMPDKTRANILIHNKQTAIRIGRRERDAIARAIHAVKAVTATPIASGSTAPIASGSTAPNRVSRHCEPRFSGDAIQKALKMLDCHVGHGSNHPCPPRNDETHKFITQSGPRPHKRAAEPLSRRHGGGESGKPRRRLAVSALDAQRSPDALLVITDDAGIKKANREYRGVDKATDVLSFPEEDFAGSGGYIEFGERADRPAKTARGGGETRLGEIMISAERAFSQAGEFGHSFERELAFLAVHGYLHLLGYDHESGGGSEMRRLAERALANAGLARDNGGGAREGADSITAGDKKSSGADRPDSPRGFGDGAVMTDLAGSGAPQDFRSGFIAVVGKANVGKSTLINTVCGAPYSAVSGKPQTTRRNARMILTTAGYQLIFEDTPGLHVPKNRLGEYMVRRAKAAVAEADAVFLVVDARDGRLHAQDEEILRLAGAPKNRDAKKPVALIINKADLVKKETILPFIAQASAKYDFAFIMPLSATRKEARDLVLGEAVKLIPAGGLLYPAEMTTDQPVRRLIEEAIREKALQLFEQEIPHGIDVEAETVRKRKDAPRGGEARGAGDPSADPSTDPSADPSADPPAFYDVSAVLYCEKESHKKIIIGKNGGALKQIGASARRDIERLLCAGVYLELWVKVRKDWRDDDSALRRMGYAD